MCRDVCDLIFYGFCMQEDGSISDYHEKFPIGSKVQAVWSEDGEW